MTVADNLFERHVSAAVNSIGDPNPANRSTGLVVRNNRSVDDSSFAVVNNTAGALIDQNQATKPATATGTIIYIVGNNDRLTVRRNVLTGGRGTGISANAAFGATASTNLLIDTQRRPGPDHRDRDQRQPPLGHGPRQRRPELDAQRRHTWAAASRCPRRRAGWSLTNNVATGSSDVDCVDASTGTRTVGTANTWTNNVGRTATPVGLCIPGRAPAAAPAPAPAS